MHKCLIFFLFFSQNMTVEMDENDDMDFNYYSDSDDGGDEEHKRLLAAISKLDKRKRYVFG